MVHGDTCVSLFRITVFASTSRRVRRLFQAHGRVVLVHVAAAEPVPFEEVLFTRATA